MLAAQPLTNWVIRGAIAPLMQFIVADLKFNASQKAVLLGAFYPGYLATQIPAGFLIQRFGAKLILTANMLGTSLCTLALPFTLCCTAPITATSIMLMLSGMFQGSLIPGHQEMKRHWLPTGSGRAVANRIIGIGLSVNALLSTSLTPFLAERFGWQSVLCQYGVASLVFAGLWQKIATNWPADTSTMVSRPSCQSSPVSKVFEWRIFSVPSVLVAVGCKGTSGLPEYCLTQWLPTEFATRFGATNTVSFLLHTRLLC